MLAGGDQNQSGTSVPIIRDILSRTNLVVFIDDPVITSQLAELMLQAQSGLTMGSQKSGLKNLQGSLLMTSNENVIQRAEGRVIVIEYRKGNRFSAEDDKKLTNGIKTIVSNNTGFLLAWAIFFKDLWDKNSQEGLRVVYDILSRLRPELQPRWHKGMAAVLCAHALFHCSVSMPPNLVDLIEGVVEENHPPVRQDDDVKTRLSHSLVSKLQNENGNPLMWINPCSHVSTHGKSSECIGVRSTALQSFSQVSLKEISEKLKKDTDNDKSIAMPFATTTECTVEHISKRIEGHHKMQKGWKIPVSYFDLTTLNKIRESCGMEELEEQEEDEEDQAQDDGDEMDGMNEVERDAVAALEEKLLCICTAYKDQYPQNSTPERGLLQTMSPTSAKFLRQLTPRRKRVFVKGIETGTKMANIEKSTTESSSDACNLDWQVEQRNKEPPRKQLFPSGTIGALPRMDMQESDEEEEASQVSEPDQHEVEEGGVEEDEHEDEKKDAGICKKCGLLSPRRQRKRKMNDLDEIDYTAWVACDGCDAWYHM